MQNPYQSVCEMRSLIS